MSRTCSLWMNIYRAAQVWTGFGSSTGHFGWTSTSTSRLTRTGETRDMIRQAGWCSLSPFPVRLGLDSTIAQCFVLYQMNGVYHGACPRVLIFRALFSRASPGMNSWHNAANVLYVDQPLGTGLSFTTDSNYANNDLQVPRRCSWLAYSRRLVGLCDTKYYFLHGAALLLCLGTCVSFRGKCILCWMGSIL